MCPTQRSLASFSTIALRIFRLNEMIRIYHDSGPEVLLVAASAALVIALPIEANGIIDIDYTGSQILRRAIAELGAMDIIVALARLSDERAQAQAHRTGLIDTIGPDRVFMSVEEAVRTLGPRAEGRDGAPTT